MPEDYHILSCSIGEDWERIYVYYTTTGKVKNIKVKIYIVFFEDEPINPNWEYLGSIHVDLGRGSYSLFLER